MVDSEQVPGKGRIHASIEKLSGRVSEKGRISVSTRKWQNPGEYREKLESVPLMKNCPDEFQKGVVPMRVLENGGIRMITGKR